MPTRLSLAALLAFLPAIALAQGAAPNAAVCDGSEIRRAEQTRTVGYSLFAATALTDLVAVLTIPHNPGGAEKAGSHFRVVAITAPIAITGAVIASRAAPGDGFWERVVGRLKVGETKTADVGRCLQRPQAKTSNGSEERWTYVMSRPALFESDRIHSLRLTFRDSVLAEVLTKDVERSAIPGAIIDPIGLRLDRRRGYCAPPIPVVADAFPTPTDTTPGAAAMARAQADAAAALKNAAAAASYASCMASDSVR